MSADTSANLTPLVSRSAAGEAFRLALRLFIGRGRRYSVKQASNGSGVKDRLIECAMEHPDSGEHRPPGLDTVLSLAAFLGPEFTCEWLALAGQGAFWLPSTDDAPAGLIAADSAEDHARIARAAADGKFGRDEKPDLHVVGTRMMARGAHLREIGRVS